MTTASKTSGVKNARTRAIESLIRELLLAITYHHEDLEVDARQLGSVAVVKVSGNRDDQPRLVGERARFIVAMNRILGCLARNMRMRIVYSLQEPQVGEKFPPRKYASNPDWKPEETRRLLNLVLKHVFSERAAVEEYHDHNVSVFQVVPDPRERWILDEDLVSALNVVFDAIGRTSGRTLYVAGLEPVSVADLENMRTK